MGGQVGQGAAGSGAGEADKAATGRLDRPGARLQRKSIDPGVLRLVAEALGRLRCPLDPQKEAQIPGSSE